VSSERLFPETVLDARPTAKVVYSVLDRRGPLTVSTLVEETGQSRRAVERALSDLADQDAAIAKPDVTEPRRDVWVLTES
jgi:DNA-binding transcriptional regulator GbsR (MarR family)